MPRRELRIEVVGIGDDDWITEAMIKPVIWDALDMGEIKVTLTWGKEFVPKMFVAEAYVDPDPTNAKKKEEIQ